MICVLYVHLITYRGKENMIIHVIKHHAVTYEWLKLSVEWDTAAVSQIGECRKNRNNYQRNQYHNLIFIVANGNSTNDLLQTTCPVLMAPRERVLQRETAASLKFPSSKMKKYSCRTLQASAFRVAPLLENVAGHTESGDGVGR